MTADREKRAQEEAEVVVDLGFGGLFKGLGSVIDLLGEMVESGDSERTRSRPFRVKGLGPRARGVYGFTVRTGIGGLPRVESFGNIRATAKGPVVADVREPLVDVFDEREEIVVVAELPGVGEPDINVEVHGDVLVLETVGERKYAKEVLLPAAVDPGSVRRSYKNGILELRLKKQAA
ncbi:MAG: Hsp20/alpha crystallin family protein [Chloroflexi bacterium]|nr:Hsp20/alpha crystallin family protein [Chloroflexota bacterium]